MGESVANEETRIQILREAPVVFTGKQMNLKITANGLNLMPDATEGGKKIKGLELSWRDVISAQATTKSKTGDVQKSFTVNYMQYQPSKKLQVKKADIVTTDESADVWITIIQEQCAQVEGRPKKLFVLVNPISGSTNGQQVFERKVQPIFEMAQIHSDVHFTEKAKHGLEIAETQDFSSYDGIVVVGGDGSYHEVLQGFTIQTQKSAGINHHDSNAIFKPLSKPIGIIPSGTGNGVSGWMNEGVIDVDTAALRVVRGEVIQSSVFSVHSNGKLFAVCGLLFGYGYFSDIIKRTDELRWMKRARYPYVLLGSVLGKKREWQCSLEYQQAPETDDAETGTTPTPSSGGDMAQAADGTTDPSWIKYDSKNSSYRGIFTILGDVFNRGGKLCCSLNRKYIPLFVDHGCGILRLFKFMFSFMMGKGTEGNLPNNLEELKRVQRFRMKITQDSSETDENVSSARARARELEMYVNADGEARRMESPELDLRVIPTFLTLYGIKTD